jgi:hypothetical protein
MEAVMSIWRASLNQINTVMAEVKTSHHTLITTITIMLSQHQLVLEVALLAMMRQ